MKRIQILLVTFGAIAFAEKLNIRTDCDNNICTAREAVLEIDIPVALKNVELEIVVSTESGASTATKIRAAKTGKWNRSLILAVGRNDVTVRATDETLGLVGRVVVYCQDGDARSNLVANGFFGVSLDSFAAGKWNAYINPDQSGQIKERAVGGISFDYRLTGSGKRQVWVYGKAMHGLRSAGVNCAEDQPGGAVCIQFDPAKPNRTLYMIRASTSLEAYMGARWEVLPLQRFTGAPAAAYLKWQVGFIAVAGAGGDLMAAHHAAAGVIAKAGTFTGSYLEAGAGMTALFPARWPRLKMDAYLQWPLLGAWLKQCGATGFARITVDSSPRRGEADSVQSYFGVNFDLSSLF